MKLKDEINLHSVCFIVIFFSLTVAFVSSRGRAVGQDIYSYLSTDNRGSSGSKLTSEEVAVVINTLVYDGRLEILRTVYFNPLMQMLCYASPLPAF